MSRTKPQPLSLNIKQFIDYYNKGQIKKPYIQRKKKWDTEKDIGYVNFAIHNENTVTVFILNEKIKDGIKYYYVWDGNNRSNALISFYNNPLELMPHLIPYEYPDNVKEIIKKSSFDILTKTTSFKKFCQNNSLLEWYQTNIRDESIDIPFEKLHETLIEMNFNEITLPTTVFQNATDEEMVSIYENVNKGGEPISYQDVLAASTYDILYNSSEIAIYNDIMNEIKNYYITNETNEKLKFDNDGFNSSNTLNLYQILLGLQYYISNKHTFIPPPCDNKGNTLDLIFDLYKNIIDEDFKIKTDKMGEFIEKLCYCTEFLEKQINILYEDNINYAKIKEQKLKTKLHKNGIIILLTYLYYNYNIINTDNINKKIKKILLYHFLTACIDIKEDKNKYVEYDSIKYVASGKHIPTKIKEIRDKNQLIIPTDLQLRELLEYINKNNISEVIKSKKSRKNINDFKKICLASYFNIMVPNSLLKDQKALDHIIPYSFTWDGELDINRLGNLMLINDIVNKKKGNKSISDEFIRENNLYYYNYPTNSEFNTICFNNKIINNNLYNIMCNNREKIFFDILINNLKD